eukprot:scaffold84702_cov17-Tisochrysis_lutea.AAC.3
MFDSDMFEHVHGTCIPGFACILVVTCCYSEQCSLCSKAWLCLCLCAQVKIGLSCTHTRTRVHTYPRSQQSLLFHRSSWTTNCEAWTCACCATQVSCLHPLSAEASPAQPALHFQEDECHTAAAAGHLVSVYGKDASLEGGYVSHGHSHAPTKMHGQVPPAAAPAPAPAVHPSPSTRGQGPCESPLYRSNFSMCPGGRHYPSL